MADFLNVNGAYSGTAQGVNVAFPGMEARTAPHIALARRVREASGIITLQASRLDTLGTANHAIESGALDLAGMTRPHIADPHIVRKLLAGEEHRIRPCVGAGYCLDRPYRGLDALCMHNPSTGRETHLPHEPGRSGRPGRAVVVGGGPAGLEAARVLAMRGHSVTLFEATDRLGGQLALAARGGWRRGVQGIIDWLAMEGELLGVAFRLNSYAEAADIEALDPDVVILATGGTPLQSLRGGGGEYAMTPWDVLGDKRAPTGDVLVYDEIGGHAALSTAQLVAEQGARVTLVTPDQVVGQDLGAQNKPVYLRALLASGAVMQTDTRLLGLARTGNRITANLRNRWTSETRTAAFDAVIIDQGVEPETGLRDALAPHARTAAEPDLDALAEGRRQPEKRPEGRFALHRIGDALMSRDAHAAIFEARRLCQTI